MPPQKSKKDKSKKQKVSNDQHTTDPSRKASETSFSGPDKLFDDDPAQERQGASDSPKPKKDKKWKVHLPNPLKTKKSKNKHQHPEETIPSPQPEESNKRKYHVASPSSGVPSEIEQHQNESFVGVSTLSEFPPRPSANRVPSLECYSRPMEEQLSPVDGSAHTDLLSSPLSEDEEEGRTIDVTKPPDIPEIERAAQRSRDSGAKFLPRISKLRDDLSSTKQKLEQKQSALEDLLSSKESAFDILKKKVDKQNLDVATLKEEVESLSKQLNTKRRDYNDLQVKYDLLCQQCKPPEVLTDAAHKLPTLTTCELTDLRSLLDTKSHDEPSTEATNQEQQSPQDNRTDAEKLQDEIEELKRNAKHDIAAHQQKIEELQAQKETLSHQLSDLLASNLHLKEVIKTAIEEAPLSADGIESGDEGKTDKLLIQIRAKYLEQSVRIVEFQEVYQKQNAELAQCKAKLNEWQERYSHKKKELEEKVKERDLQLKEQRQSDAPPTSILNHFETDSACKGPEHEAALNATLKKKDEEIQSLTVQLQAFQEVSSQRQKLHEHSKTQSTVVVQLRKDLEAAQQELEVVRSKSESAKTIEALHKMIIQVNVELRDLKLEKNGIEDELDILKNECEAAENAHQSTRHELAQAQSSIASLRAVQEKGKTTLVADEGGDLTEMNILRGLARLHQIEVVELQRKEKRYKATLSELGKSKMAQERKLIDLQEERDSLAQQNTHLLAARQTFKGQLEKFDVLKTQVEVTQEHVSALAETIVTKTEVIEALEAKVKGLEDELEATKFQAFQYEQDFEEERQARAEAVGARNSDYGNFSHKVQSLTEQLEQAKSETEIERKEKQAVISRLDTLQEAHLDLQRYQRLIKTMEGEQRLQQIDLQKCQERNEMLLKANQHLKTKIERLQEQCQRPSSASQRGKEDELAPFIISQLPNLGEHQGSGSYGSVYRIQLNGINCIAKKLHDIFLGQGGKEAVGTEDKSAIYEKFQRECVLLSRMRHPNIVQFMGVHFGPRRDYGRELTLVMERLYMDLEECLKKYQNVDTWLKVSILLDISQGLLHLHSQGIVHRDLTAANILLTSSFHAKIADLGVSKILSVHPLHATKQSMIPGALGYMPPEVQAEVPQYGYPLDIFSFGVLMLFVIIQEYPQFYENAMTHTGFQQREVQIQKRMKWIRRLSPEDPMRQLICRCLQDDPQRRPTTTELNSKVVEFSTQHPKPYKDILDMQKQMQAQYPVQFPMASTLARIHNSSQGRNHQ